MTLPTFRGPEPEVDVDSFLEHEDARIFPKLKASMPLFAAHHQGNTRIPGFIGCLCICLRVFHSNSIATWTILVTMLWVMPGNTIAGKSWTSVNFGQVPEGSPVWMRLRVDTVALEAAVAARWFLIRSSDSLRTLPGGSRLQVSDLNLVRPSGTAKVTGQTWKSLHQEKVLLTFEFRDSHGKSGDLDAWLETEAIDRVFVLQQIQYISRFLSGHVPRGP